MTVTPAEAGVQPNQTTTGSPIKLGMTLFTALMRSRKWGYSLSVVGYSGIRHRPWVCEDRFRLGRVHDGHSRGSGSPAKPNDNWIPNQVGDDSIYSFDALPEVGDTVCLSLDTPASAIDSGFARTGSDWGECTTVTPAEAAVQPNQTTTGSPNQVGDDSICDFGELSKAG